MPTFDEAPRPFPEAEMPRAYLVQPVLHSEELSVCFSLPGVEKNKASSLLLCPPLPPPPVSTA